MKTLIKFFFTFLIPVQIIFAQEQHIYSQKETAYVNYIKPTNQPAYPWADREHRVGYWSGGYDVANFNYWEWTQNIIPIEATVTSVNIKFRAKKSYYLHSFKFYLYNIPYKINSGINLYDQCTINNRLFTSEVYNPNSNYEVFVDLTFTSQSQVGSGWEVWNAVNNAVKSGNYYFALGIREAPNSIYPTWNLIQYEDPVNIFSPAIDLTISYTTPDNYYKFKNRIQNTENYGNLILNNDLLNPIASGSSPIFLSWGSQNTVRTNELPFIVNWNNTNTVQKHNYWDLQSSDYEYSLHHNFQAIPSSPSEMKATFLPTFNTEIENYYSEINLFSGGNINFKDPWFYYRDQNNNWFHSNEFKNYSSPLTIQNNSSTSYGGVFLNQGYNPINNTWTPPYYSVKVDAVQDINLQNTGYPWGRNHKFYFQNWGGTNVNYKFPNSLETPVVFTLNGATAQANLKGTQLSNRQFAGGYGQRSFVRSTNGYLHNVYESMGDIWYERSTDNGTTWLLMNDGKPINPDYQTADAKSPSVCFDANYNLLYVVYQSSTFPYYGIVLEQFGTSSQTTSANWVETIAEPESYSYSNNYKPVIAVMGGEGVVVYDLPSTVAAGLKGVKFYIDTDNSLLGTNNFTIPGADQYSENPSIVAGCQKYYLVYEENQTSIRYATWNGGSNPTAYSTVSSGSSYLYNVRPTISLEHCTYPVVSWIGGTYDYYHSGFYQGSCVMTRVGPTWGAIKIISASNTQVVNNNSTTEYGSEYKSVITYSYLYGSTYYTKWVKREGTSYTNPAQLSYNSFPINGIWPQVSSGASINDMKALVYNSSSLPYYFIQSTTNLGSGLGKISLAKTSETDTIVTFGRSGVIDKNGVEFAFEIGDILVGDKIINFIEVPDTIAYTSLDQLNKDTRTENFTLSPETDFYFSNIYSVVKKSNPDSVLTSSDAVNFKAELVNALTNQVVGTFDNVTYNKNNLEKYASIDYQVDCSGITPGEYYLRLVTDETGNANYTLANIVRDNTKLAKKSFNKVNFTGKEIPTTYDLAQNYPNPFNPRTTILYQLPKDGLVTLKIYDILGREVATLVNEEKITGKYEVNFDASQLASGVYIYQLTTPGFTQARKMILAK